MVTPDVPDVTAAKVVCGATHNCAPGFRQKATDKKPQSQADLCHEEISGNSL